MSNIESALVVARAYMPYYSGIMYTMRYRPSKLVDTAATSTGWVMLYNEEWFESLTHEEAAAIICHEVSHIVKEFWARLGARDPKLWNIAQDLEINVELNELGRSGNLTPAARQIRSETGRDFKLPDHTVLPEQFGLPPKALCDDYYTMLKEKKEEAEADGDGQNPFGLPQDGEGSAGAGNCGSIADNNTAGESEAQKGSVTQTGKEMAIDGAMEAIKEMGAKNAGSVPDSLLRMAEDYINNKNKVSWQTLLRRAISWHNQIIRGQYDYSTTKFRARNPTNFFLPGLVDYEPNVLFAFDTSGSMSQGEIEASLTEAVGLLESIMGTPTLVAIDASMDEPMTTRNLQDFIERGLTGGGGTDMGVAVQYADEKKFNVCVIGTDGYTPWPAEDPVAQVIVLGTSPDNGQYDVIKDRKNFTFINISEDD